MKALEILVRITRTPQDLFRYSDKELYEAIAELEALQQRNCEGCKYCAKVFSYTYPLCTRDEQSPFQIHNKEVLACRFHEAKDNK